jgi:uncharacterized protein Smg (DUF494 family)
MSTLFDTHAAVQKLKETGFTEQQAEAQVHMLWEMLQSNLATKEDIAGVKHDIEALRLATKADLERLSHETALLEERTKGRFTLLQWMIGFNIALTVLVLAKLFS